MSLLGRWIHHLKVGELGEDMAAHFLQKRGLRIIQRRVRFGRLEIDIVARDGREWVFIEVKTRRTKRYGTSVEAMGARKKASFLKAVEAYVNQYGLEREPVRCDFLGIDLNDDGEPVFSYYPGGITW